MASIRNLFPRAARGGYLDTAAEGLLAPGVTEAVEEYLREKASGTPGRRRHFALEEEVRHRAAAFLGADPSAVTFLPSASDALNILATSLVWQPGDRVVTTELEFPSNILPWLALRQHGVEVVVVRGRDGAIDEADVIAAIDERTRLVTVSAVSYRTGARLPSLTGISAAAHAAGAVFCVDATQALGRSAVSLEGVDFLLASSFKWLLATHGAAVVYVSPRLRERLEPIGVGWYSVDPVAPEHRLTAYELKPGANCLAAGMPNFATLYALNASIRFLSGVDLHTEGRRLDALCVYLRACLAAAGLPVLTPADPALVSGIVSFSHPDGEAVMNALAAQGVVVWGGDGRVRASLHTYNDASDVEALLAALPTALAEVAVA